MKIDVYVPAMIFLSGFVFYAAIRHYAIAHRGPQRRVNLTFAFISFLMALYILLIVPTLQAQTVNDFIPALKSHFAVLTLLLGLLPWFFAEYAGVRPRTALAVLTGLAGMLFFVNLTQSHTILYNEIRGLERVALPWGEIITLPLSTLSNWAYIAILYIYLNIAFGFYVLAVRFRRDRRRTTLFMVLALALLTAGSVSGILFRMWMVHIPPLGPFGFLGMVIIMELSLNREIQEDRKKVEDALKKSEARYRQLIENAPVAIAIARAGRFMYVNPAFVGMLRLQNKDEVMGQPIVESIAPDHRDKFLERARLHEQGLPVEVQYETVGQRKDGSQFPVIASSSQVNLPEGPAVIGFYQDITERKRAEVALKDSVSNFRALVDNSPDIIAIFDRDGRYIFVNPAITKVSKRKPEDFIGKKISEIEGFTQEDAAEREKIIKRIFETQEPFESEFLFNAPDGTHVFEWRVYPAIDAAGNVLSVFSINREITARKQAEAATEASQRLLKLIIENAPMRVFWKDAELRYLGCNTAFARDAGMSRPEDLIGKDDFQMAWREQAELYRADDRLVMDSDTQKLGYEEPQTTPDGHTVWLRTSKVPLHASDGRVFGILGIYEDITSRKRAEKEHYKLEEELRHTQKLEGIGQLAGGIAHDFNNILSAVVGFAGLLQMKMDKSDPLKHFADEIASAAQRGANITHQILAFSRKQVLDMKPVDLNEIIHSLEKMLYRLVREDVSIEIDLFDKALVVLADTSQIGQVLINLVTNARDAMPQGGRLSIATGHFFMSSDYVRMNGYGAQGEYALLTVSDSGTGMDPETKAKIFEPFFTTKELGKGTGLGLAVVHGIVKQHGGFIDVYSEEGKGTRFKILLPLTEHIAEQTEIKPTVEIKGGTETILIAEDDATLRKLSTTILSHYGYQVIEAIDGDDAIGKFVENCAIIRLAILDGIMPHKNGREAFEEIRRLCPNTKAIFLSGYAEDIFAHDGILDNTAVFIQKPVKPEDLLSTVRNMLDK